MAEPRPGAANMTPTPTAVANGKRQTARWLTGALRLLPEQDRWLLATRQSPSALFLRPYFPSSRLLAHGVGESTAAHVERQQQRQRQRECQSPSALFLWSYFPFSHPLVHVVCESGSGSGNSNARRTATATPTSTSTASLSCRSQGARWGGLARLDGA